jgi:tetratricopeptide (TPR) repeat protein
MGNASHEILARWGLARLGVALQANYRIAIQLSRQVQDFTMLAQLLIDAARARAMNPVRNYQEALRLSQRTRDSFLQFQALMGLGQVKKEKNKKWLTEALNLAMEMGDLSLQAQAYLALGHARVENEYLYFAEALRLASTVGDSLLQARAHLGLGYVFRSEKSYFEAAKHFLEVLRLQNRGSFYGNKADRALQSVIPMLQMIPDQV